MTHETFKVLLMVFLLGGLRAAIFVTEIPTAQRSSLYQAFLEWMTALVWPAAISELNSRTAPILQRSSSGRKKAVVQDRSL